MSKQGVRPGTVALLVLVIATLVLAGFAVRHVEQAGANPRAVPGGQQDQPTASLWLGDSYTAGTGASDPQHGEAWLTSNALGWLCDLDAQGGTGFVNDGHLAAPANQPLPARLAKAAATYDPDVVVIDAGRNDADQPRAAVRAATEDYFAKVRAAWPDAKIVAIAPYFITSPDQPLGDGWADFEKALAEKYDGTFVDPIAEGWITPAAQRMTVDGKHPTPRGHRYLARHLAEALRGVNGSS